METGVTMMGEEALMEALKSLKISEAENERLRKEITILRDADKTVQMYQSKLDELLTVNHQWDLEFKEQEEAFKRYHVDSQQAQSENQDYIAKLKQDKDTILHEVETLKHKFSQVQQQLSEAHRRNQRLEDQLVSVNRHHDNSGVSAQKVKQLEENNSLLQQQVKAFKEDFEAERRDRERLIQEKQSAALRYDAEVTSLKLQLDRCRNELGHYTTEATRLGQQLRLKNHFEEEQYKKHLESHGYVSRAPNGALPPLDPFVEVDPPAYNGKPTGDIPFKVPKSPHHLSNGSINSPSRGVVPRSKGDFKGHLLARSSDIDLHSAPGSIDSTPMNLESAIGGVTGHHSKIPSPPLRRVDPPHENQQNHNSHRHHNGMNSELSNTHDGSGHTGPLLPGPNSDGAGYIMKNGDVVSSTNNDWLSHDVTRPPNEITPPSPGYNSHSPSNSDQRVKPVPRDRRNSLDILEPKTSLPFYKEVFANNGIHKVPQAPTNGRFKCKRCARRFSDKTEYTDHKARCIS